MKIYFLPIKQVRLEEKRWCIGCQEYKETSIHNIVCVRVTTSSEGRLLIYLLSQLYLLYNLILYTWLDKNIGSCAFYSVTDVLMYKYNSMMLILTQNDGERAEKQGCAWHGTWYLAHNST